MYFILVWSFVVVLSISLSLLLSFHLHLCHRFIHSYLTEVPQLVNILKSQNYFITNYFEAAYAAFRILTVLLFY